MINYYTVKFHAVNHFTPENDCPGMSGEIFIIAKDIFDALEKANNKVHGFGFDTVVIDGVETRNEQKEEVNK